MPVSKSLATIPTQVTAEESSDDKTWIDGVSESESVDSTHYSVDLEEESTGTTQEEEKEEIEDIATALGTMTVGSTASKEYLLGFTYPYLIYKYVEDRQQKVCIDMMVMTMDMNFFEAKFNKQGTELLLYTKVPAILFKKERLMMANTELKQNNTNVVEFEKCVETVTKTTAMK